MNASSIPVSYFQTSAALERANDLDIIAGSERRCRPFRPPHHVAVNRNGEKPRVRVDAALGQQVGDRRRRHVFLDAVDLETGHTAALSRVAAGAEAKRAGENGSALSGSLPVSTSWLTTAAVTGVKRMPLR